MEDWKLYGFLDLQKSLTGETEDKICGIIMDDSKDQQGETALLKSMDWTYFDSKGYIKYEHDVAGPNPRTVIGVPLIRKSLPEGEFIEGSLLFRPEDDLKKGLPDYARETVALIKALNEHNKKHPENARTIGFSIEGKYLGKSADGNYWGKVHHVVVTPQPVNANTWAEMAKSANQNLFKSLQTGSSLPGNQTGGAALRKESIAGVKTKMDFKTPEEAKDYYMKQEGFNEADAQTKADEIFAQKSLNDNVGLLTKAITAMTDLFKSKKAPEPEMEEEDETDMEDESEDDPEMEKGCKKSFAYDDSEEIPDVTPYFVGLVKSLRSNESIQESMLKSISVLADGFNNLVSVQNAKIQQLEKSLADQTKMIKAIGMASGDISFLVNNEKVTGENGKMHKSEVGELLFDLMTKGKVSPQAVTAFEISGQLPESVKALPEFKALSA